MKFIAVDFDGCLCEDNFPEIGPVKEIIKEEFDNLNVIYVFHERRMRNE